MGRLRYPNTGKLLLSQTLITIWIETTALAYAHACASRSFPLESGGILMGYWSSPTKCVIRHVTGPGPNASHFRYRYIPDYKHDEEAVLRHYWATGGADVYLGDWHSHPNTTKPYLSRKDRKAMRTVALSEGAKAPRPLSMVCAGDDFGWGERVWVGEVARYWFGYQTLVVLPTTVITY